MSTTAPFTFNTDERALAAQILAAVQGERQHGESKASATRQLLQSLGAIDPAGQITESGDLIKDSALARAIVPATWTDSDGKVITFVWVSAQSKAGTAVLNAGKAADVDSQEYAYSRYLLDCGAVQVAISAAKASARKAAGKASEPTTRGPGKSASEKDADVVTPATTGQETLPGAPVVTVTTTPAESKSVKVDHVASILAMSDDAASAALVAILTAMTHRAAPEAAVLAAVAYVKAHAAPAKATPATARKRTTAKAAAE